MALKDYVQSLPPDVQEKVKIFLFADKNIPDTTMDSIVVEMKNRIVRDIYIVYDTNIPNYSFEGIYWKTKKTTSNKIISSQ
ncbi:hypothetical protein ACOKFD_11680 [Flagellimonas sp. S174]|uniref:hypothetical protein n=1 Tax=Flagellimonas sp. S174 TaxID=3410790 RepID=UPI003BF487CF